MGNECVAVMLIALLLCRMYMVKVLQPLLLHSSSPLSKRREGKTSR